MDSGVKMREEMEVKRALRAGLDIRFDLYRVTSKKSS